MHLLKMLLFIFIATTASSCKSCNCPAYSYDKYKSKPEQATAFYQEPKVVNMPASAETFRTSKSSSDN